MIDGVWALAIICEKGRNEISDAEVGSIIGQYEKVVEKGIEE